MAGVPVWSAWPASAGAEEWSSWSGALASCSPYQRWEWGEFARAGGARVVRLQAQKDGRTCALLQGELHAAGGLAGALWVNGGPMGDLRPLAAGLFAGLRRAVRLPVLHVRLDLHREALAGEVEALGACGWQRPRQRMHTGRSMVLDLTPAPEDLLAGLSKNWRHNLRRAQKTALVIAPWPDPDPATVHALHRELWAEKGLPHAFSEAWLRDLFRYVGPHITTLACRDASGRVFGLRACLRHGTSARDLLAVTTGEARTNWASYALCWELLFAAKAAGATAYDLGGIDPDDNPGVYQFKSGLGGREISYLGEWEQTRPAILGPLVDAILRRRWRR